MTTPDEAHIAIEIELCGRLADAGGAFIEATIPASGCSVAELFALVAQQHPWLSDALASDRIKACVNDVVVAPEAGVKPGDRVALFPPVSGG